MGLSNEFFVGTQGGAVSPTVLGVARQKTAGGVYMAQLGDYQFALETSAFETLQRKTEYRWQSIARLGRRPAMQFMGAGEDTIELAGTIYPHFRGGLTQMAMMRAAAGDGKPLPLTYAFENAGQYAGRWCITSVTDNRSVFFRDGAARKIDFSISLSAYGEDEDQFAAIVKAATAAAAAALALNPPAGTQSSATDLQANSLAVEALPAVDASSTTEQVRAASTTVTGATKAAAVMSGIQRQVLQRALQTIITGRVPTMRTVVGDIIRVAETHDVINRDTMAAIRVIATSRGDVQAVARSVEILMRRSATQARASVGRVESQYQAGTGDVVADASLANVVRSGLGIVYAAEESARQLAAIAGKITP